MAIPFWPEWNASIPFLLEQKPSFRLEWNGHSIPAGMECHFFNNLKKYASRVAGWLAGWVGGNLVKIMLAQLELSLAKTLITFQEPLKTLKTLQNLGKILKTVETP